MATVTPTPASCAQLKRKAGCQDLSEEVEWGWDATKFMRRRSGDTIATVVWTVPTELTKVNEAVVGNVFWVLIRNNGGLADTVYPIFADLTTSQGAKLRFRIDITLQDITQ